MKLKLDQGQIWRQGETYLRITKWSRQAIDYKAFTDLVTREGPVVGVTKKEFCRLIKGGELMTADQLAKATATAAENAAAAPPSEPEAAPAEPATDPTPASEPELSVNEAP